MHGLPAVLQAKKHVVKPLTAVVAGHICLDIFPDLVGYTSEVFQKSFLPGHLLNIGPIFYSTGGPVPNTGLALHKLGVETSLMGKIGDDFSGTILLHPILWL